jgi:N-acetylmuramoyl-L-alanine amidase
MNPADVFMLALCLYREARGDGLAGMTAVGCVVRNRVNKHKSSYYAEVVKPWQFSSITAKGDPELTLFPASSDPSWAQAQSIAAGIINGTIADRTEGATIYYANTIPFPASWNRAVLTPTVTVGNQLFFREA